MKQGRCPYHVKQGFVDKEGKLILSDVCGLKSAQGQSCPYAQAGSNYKTCDRYLAHQAGLNRQMLLPKNDLEYLPSFCGSSSFSEMELL